MLWQMLAGAVTAAVVTAPVHALAYVAPPAQAPVRESAVARVSSSAAAPGPAAAPVTGEMLRPFQPPATPYGPGHRGVDLRGRPGEVVRAAMDGIVRFAGPVAGVVWVTIAHVGGLETTYGGLTPTVRVGERVSIGQPIGRVTGGARLDWGARRNGEYVDPIRLFGGWEVRLVPLR